MLIFDANVGLEMYLTRLVRCFCIRRRQTNLSRQLQFLWRRPAGLWRHQDLVNTIFVLSYGKAPHTRTYTKASHVTLIESVQLKPVIRHKREV